MSPRRVSSPAEISASTATAFDHITTTTFVVVVALVFGTVIRYGPNAAVDHIRDVLAGLPDLSSADLDIDPALRAMYFGINPCPILPLCVMG